jgi:Domain of unknown function (DUF4440)
MNSSEPLSCYGCNAVVPKCTFPKCETRAASWLPSFVGAGRAPLQWILTLPGAAAVPAFLAWTRRLDCRRRFPFALLLVLLVVVQVGVGQSKPDIGTEMSPQMKAMFEAKVKAEWEALKNKDRKAYGDLLADDFQGVEVDGKGERTRIQAINELAEENVSNYTLWGFKEISLGPDAAFVIYEVTMQFPPKSVVRYSRVYISELWVKRGGEWKVLHYQETHVK